MKTKLTKRAVALFESIKKTDDNGIEYWSSRDLARILEYKDYRNFLLVLNKAKESCNNSNVSVRDHFVDVTDMVTIGSGATRVVESVRLSRYACYLTVQNADPNKPIVAQVILNQTHYDVGKKVRQTIEDLGGTMPEDLPTAESIKSIETKHKNKLKDKE